MSRRCPPALQRLQASQEQRNQSLGRQEAWRVVDMQVGTVAPNAITDPVDIAPHPAVPARLQEETHQDDFPAAGMGQLLQGRL